MILTVMALRREPLKLRPASLGFAATAGLLDMGANIAFLLASRSGLLMLSSAITSLYPAPTVILAWIFLKQRLSWPRMAGLAMAIAGCALIAIG
jgi:drug/metabolite transporter (DMT)-like permease